MEVVQIGFVGRQAAAGPGGCAVRENDESGGNAAEIMLAAPGRCLSVRRLWDRSWSGSCALGAVRSCQCLLLFADMGHLAGSVGRTVFELGRNPRRARKSAVRRSWRGKGDRAMRGLPCFSKRSSTTSMANCRRRCLRTSAETMRHRRKKQRESRCRGNRPRRRRPEAIGAAGGAHGGLLRCGPVAAQAWNRSAGSGAGFRCAPGGGQGRGWNCRRSSGRR